MRKVLVIGSGGSGKSTFANSLSGITGLPVLHLDQHYWRPGWQAPAAHEWDAVIAELLTRECWIMDGNYGGTLEARLAACDTVIFLDMPRRISMLRVLRRWLSLRGQIRTDVAEGCPERLTWSFLEWVWTYPARRRPKIMRRLQELAPDQSVAILRSPAEVDKYLKRVAARQCDGSKADITPNLQPDE